MGNMNCTYKKLHLTSFPQVMNLKPNARRLQPTRNPRPLARKLPLQLNLTLRRGLQTLLLLLPQLFRSITETLVLEAAAVLEDTRGLDGADAEHEEVDGGKAIVRMH